MCCTEGIFGQCLESTMKFEQDRDPSRQVPEIVEMCVEFLYANGLQTDGLFRFIQLATILHHKNSWLDRDISLFCTLY